MPTTEPVRETAEPCGDPTCDHCQPPAARCQACGALHDRGDVPFCSLACALVDEALSQDQPPRR